MSAEIAQSVLKPGFFPSPRITQFSFRKKWVTLCAKDSIESKNGALDTNRTCDPPLRRGMLYPLSYEGVAKTPNRSTFPSKVKCYILT